MMIYMCRLHQAMNIKSDFHTKLLGLLLEYRALLLVKHCTLAALTWLKSSYTTQLECKIIGEDVYLHP